MFRLFQSERSKLRGAGKNWLYLAHKVYNFRKDELSDADISELGRRIDALRTQLKSKEADAGTLKLAIEGIEGHMRKVGGAFYPQSSFSENVDFILYFLILYLGFTAFFIKPFKIPTNSMWPTYNGMTSEVWTEDEPAPGLISRAFRLVAKGAMRYKMVSPANGELLIPVEIMGRQVSGLATAVVPKRHHVIIPGKGTGYLFEVGGESMLFKVPMDFDLEREMPMGLEHKDSILGKAWFPGESSFWEVMQDRMSSGQVARRERIRLPDGRSADVAWVKSGLSFHKGEVMLSFDLHTGDQLFVDRMSYHFVRPKVGDGFVFKTSEVDGLKNGRDSYYIKRLAGVEGDVMQIEDGKLYVNGEEPDGSVAFFKNNNKVPPYRGYLNSGSRLLRRGETITVPEGMHVALGDNSANSSDSRMWGYVPERAIVGKPVMIFYPFTHRFGLVE